MLHYISSFAQVGNYARSSSLSSSWRTSKLNQPLRDASTNDLIDLLSERLGKESLDDEDMELRKANAVLVMLARNSEVNGAAEAVKQLEDRFNHKYHYPWVFLNDEPFSEDFIQCVYPALSTLHFIY